jgi:PAS domain S-box-containing protein
MLVWWGPGLIQFYNDAYRQTMGHERHPGALGQAGRDYWQEIWPAVGPQIDSLMARGAVTRHEARPVPANRHGALENVWWTYEYSPIEQADGVNGVQGVLVVCKDVTAERSAQQELSQLNRLLSQEVRLRQESERRQAFRLNLADALRGLTDPKERAATGLSLLGNYALVSRAYYKDIDEASDSFEICYEWKRSEMPGIEGIKGRLSDFGPAALTAMRDGRNFIVNDIVLDSRTASFAQAYARLGANACLVVPLVKAGRLVAAVILHQTEAYQWPSSEVPLIEDVAERTWGAIEQARDYSKRQQAETALADEKMAESERLRSLFRQAPGCICITHGPDHVFNFVNASYVRVVGERDLLGKPLREALPEMEGQGIVELLDQVFQTGAPYCAIDTQLTLQRTPGGPFSPVHIDFVLQPIFDANQSVTGIFVEGFDVTERTAAKSALEATRQRLQEGMQAARMAIWSWDLSSKKIQFSDTSADIFGGTWAKIDDIWSAIHSDDLNRLHAARNLAIAGAGTYEEVVRVNRPDGGGTLWLQIHGKVICNSEGAPIAVRGVSIDVTARKQAEEALRHADRRKDEFLAMLAHELRNPLAPISAAAEILQRARHDEQQVKQTCQIIKRQVGHMTSLVNDLLDVSRVTTGMVTIDSQLLEVKDIIADSVEQVRPLLEEHKHHFTSTISGGPLVMGDRKRLVQAVTNLLQNAAKYTPEGGAISLSTVAENGEINIVVADNGIGIDPELAPHIFDLFTQGQRSSERFQGGLGLGLALVKSLIGLHGGAISAASEGCGKGASFTISLPLASGPAQIKPVDQPDAPARRLSHRLRVLVVDDNKDAAILMGMLLEQAGHFVTIENDAYGALERAKQEPPDACILDIGLRGMDGNHLARQLRSMPTTALVPLIAVTGYGREFDREASAAAGFDHFFVKPAEPHDLIRVLSDIECAATGRRRTVASDTS